MWKVQVSSAPIAPMAAAGDCSWGAHSSLVGEELLCLEEFVILHLSKKEGPISGEKVAGELL